MTEVNCFACGDVTRVPSFASEEARERAKCRQCRNADDDAEEDDDFEEIWG
jgi:hypothetical protein